MSTPETVLDPRFSDSGAVPVGWDETLAVLEAAELFWIATVRADGRPHVTPLVAVWLDGAVHFSSGVAEQKVVNLTGNPQVTLTTGCSDWDGGLDVVVEGVAIQVTEATMLERLAGVWATKWDGRWQWRVGDGCFHHRDIDEVVLVFSVRPTKVLAFAKGDFSHTSHRF
jgi:general stress protein 26